VAAQGRNVDFIDQVAKERRLGEDFGVEKRRSGLERYLQQLFESMKPARRVDIGERNGEDQAPEKPSDESRETACSRFGAPADDVVALVDSLQERPQVIREIGLG
jgi:hypothetical protein